MRSALAAGIFSAILTAAVILLNPMLAEITAEIEGDKAPMTGAANLPIAPPPPKAALKPPGEKAQNALPVLLGLINRKRKAAGFKPLEHDPELAEVADRHAADMFQRGFSQEVNPDGLTASDRVGLGHRRLIGTSREVSLPLIKLAKGEDINPAPGMQIRLMADGRARRFLLEARQKLIGIGLRKRGGKANLVLILAAPVAFLAKPLPESIQSGAMLKLKARSVRPGWPAPKKCSIWSTSQGKEVLPGQNIGSFKISLPPGGYRLFFAVKPAGQAEQYLPGPAITVQ